MDFSDALTLLKQGDRVARKGWNGKGMWIFLARAEANAISYKGEAHYCRPFIGMYPADQSDEEFYPEVIPWLASQADLLAEDWETVL